MTLRTSRRRISPRARRRYHTIRNFFRRTLDSLTSPTSMRISSSIAVNAADSKHLNNTVKEERENNLEVYGVGDFTRSDTENSILTEGTGMNHFKNQKRRDGLLENKETKLLYKTSDNVYTTSHDIIFNSNNESDRAHHSPEIINNGDNDYVGRLNLERNKYITHREFHGLRSKNRNKSHKVIEDSMSGLGSSDSFAKPIHHKELPGPWYGKDQITYNLQLSPNKIKTKRRKHKTKPYKPESPSRPDEIRYKNIKKKPPASSEHFKPLHLFDNKTSEFSKISYPVCRDQHHSTRELKLLDSDVHTCCREPDIARRQAHRTNVCNIRSMCDTRLYSTHRQPRLQHRQCFANDYNDASIYDVFPVKEKSSPKSRRKFIEDNMISNEILPSPKTQRLIRLDWESSKYSDYEDYDHRPNQSRRRQYLYHRKRPKHVENFRQEKLSDEFPLNGLKQNSSKYPIRIKKSTRLQNDMGAIVNHEQYAAVPPSPRTFRPQLNLEVQNYEDFQQHQNQLGRKHENFRHNSLLDELPRNRNTCVSPNMAPRAKFDRLQNDMDSQECLVFPNDTAVTNLNKKDVCQDGNKADKTDNALSEIKNILQSFLQEVKKDSSTTKSDDMSGTFNENSGKPLNGSPRGNGNETSNTMKNSTASSFNCGLVHGGIPIQTMPAQFMPSFGNPCCYPSLIPMHDPRLVPCIHNSCGVLNCMCVGASRNHQTTDENSKCRRCSRMSCTSEVEPTQKESETDELIRAIYNYVVQKPSVNKDMSKNFLIQGKDARLSKSMGKSMHALQQDAKVGTPPLRYSKSCEAIPSAQLFDTYYPTNPSYSDSLLEKVSHEEMDFVAPYETNEYRFVNKQTPNNASKQQSHNSKFITALRFLRNKKNKKEKIHEVCKSEQSIVVDVMPKRGHNFQQEFATYTMHGQEFLHPPPQPYPRIPPAFEANYPPYEPQVTGYQIPINERYNNSYYDFVPIPSPVYDHQSQHTIPQRPLYLREVEVRSIGIQSEKKTPIFSFFPQNNKTQTSLTERRPVGILREDGSKNDTSQTIQSRSKNKARKLFDLKKPVGKWETEASMSEKIVKDFTKNDANISNAMIKKLFHKRNPFSPQNRFVRTIMEKDTPVVKWRPRFFV